MAFDLWSEYPRKNFILLLVLADVLAALLPGLQSPLCLEQQPPFWLFTKYPHFHKQRCESNRRWTCYGHQFAENLSSCRLQGFEARSKTCNVLQNEIFRKKQSSALCYTATIFRSYATTLHATNRRCKLSCVTSPLRALATF